jgi:predicted transposase/invertase (TIGR01784 family)
MEIHVLNLERLPAEKNPMIEEAYSKLQVMSEDEANRMIYEARLKAQRDEYSRIQGAFQDGRKAGWQDGRKAGRAEGWQDGLSAGWKEVISQMAEYGMDAKTIAAITHLSEGEVGAILDK